MKISIIILLVSVSFAAGAQTANKKLNKNLTRIQKKSNLPGFAIAIIKYDSVIFSKGYGFADKKNKQPYTTATIQPIGSVSKTFIGLALMKAIEQGYFTLETNINDILPFKVINPNFPTAEIKIKHLATHTSGLLDNDSTYMNTYTQSSTPAMELKDFLVACYSTSGKFYNAVDFAKYEPGKSYSYSNIASSLAAYLIEIKAGVPFYVYTEKYILEPLKMTGSDWFYNQDKAKNYAVLYEVNKQLIPLYETLLNRDGSLKTYSCSSYPDGSLKSSVNDLTSYLIAMMHGYFNQSDLLSKENFKLLFQKQFTESNMPLNMDVKEPNRAVFWAYNRKGKIVHTGSDPGVSAFISLDPATKIGRIILLNTELDGEDNIKTIEYFKQIITALDEFETTVN